MVLGCQVVSWCTACGHSRAVWFGRGCDRTIGPKHWRDGIDCVWILSVCARAGVSGGSGANHAAGAGRVMLALCAAAVSKTNCLAAAIGVHGSCDCGACIHAMQHTW